MGAWLADASQARITLATNQTLSEYFTKIKSLAYEMAAASRKLEDEEFVSYVLTWLDQDFDSIVSVVAAPVKPITIVELHTELIAHEQRLEMHNGGSQSSVNLAAKGKGRGGNFSHGRRSGSSGRGRNGGRGNRGGFTCGGGTMEAVAAALSSRASTTRSVARKAIQLNQCNPIRRRECKHHL
jgi:uncharacterized membrane protein YgcG